VFKIQHFFSSFLPLEIVSREIKTNEHKLENNRRPHIIDLRLIRRNFMKWQFLPKREVNLLCAVFYYFLIYARLFLFHEKQFPKVRKMKKSVVFWTHVFKVNHSEVQLFMPTSFHLLISLKKREIEQLKQNMKQDSRYAY
jgi:Iap family predicted aminopeptidase